MRQKKYANYSENTVLVNQEVSDSGMTVPRVRTKAVFASQLHTSETKRSPTVLAKRAF